MRPARTLDAAPGFRFPGRPAPGPGWPSRMGKVYAQMISPRSVLTLLFRHKWMAAGLFAALFAPAALVTFALPEIYQSDARLLVKIGRENITQDLGILEPSIAAKTQALLDEVKSEIHILKSRPVLDSIVNEIGAERILGDGAPEASPESAGPGFSPKALLVRAGLVYAKPPHEAAAAALLDNVGTALEENTIRLSYQSGDPALARDVLSSWIRHFLVHHIHVHESKATPEFFLEKTERIMGELVETNGKLKQLYAEHGILSAPMQKELLLQRLNDIQIRMNGAEVEIERSAARAATLAAELGGIPPRSGVSETAGKASAEAAALKAQLVQLRLEEQDLLKKYPPGHRLVETAANKIAIAQTALDGEGQAKTETTTAFNPLYLALREELELENARLASLRESRNRMVDIRGRIEDELAYLIGREPDFEHLERNLEALENEYLEYYDNYQKAVISKQLDLYQVSNISVIQDPALPAAPAKPNRPLNLVLGALFALGAAVSSVFVRGFFLDDTVNSDEEIRLGLGVPVVGSVPALRGAPSAARDVQYGKSILYLYKNIQKLANPDRGTLIQIAGPGRNEGKTALIRELARVGAEQYRRRVLLLDWRNGEGGDFRPHAVAMEDFTEDWRPPAGVHLFRMDLFSRDHVAGNGFIFRARDHFARLRDRFDLILCELHPDSQTLADIIDYTPLMDGVLVVIEAERTRRPRAEHLIAMLNDHRANVMGAVLNKRRHHIPAAVYNKFFA